jgi:hypothetical protein
MIVFGVVRALLINRDRRQRSFTTRYKIRLRTRPKGKMRDSSGQSPPDMVKLGAFRSAVREPTVSKPYLKEHQEYNLQAMHGEVFFLMD